MSYLIERDNGIALPPPNMAVVIERQEGEISALIDSNGVQWVVSFDFLDWDTGLAPIWLIEICDPINPEARGAATWAPLPEDEDMGVLTLVSDYTVIGPNDDYIARRGRWYRNTGSI